MRGDGSALLGKVERLLRSLGCDAASMVVAVSGGPDSVALLRALHELWPRGRWIAAHLNHQLRGGDSEADEQLVRDLAKSLTPPVELACESRNVAERAQAARANLEETARQLRYDWLRQVALTAGAPWVATGHTSDDQAETVLHRLLRGAGLRGLRGIAASRELAPTVTLVRPLLHVTRAEVIDFLASRRQDFRLDRSNFDIKLTRNRIRHELLPHLAEVYNPEIARILVRLAEEADAGYRVIEARAARLLGEAERPRAGGAVVLDRPSLSAEPRDLIREMFRLVWRREGWPEGSMSFDAWDRLAGVALGEASAIDLPGAVQARCRERVVLLARAS